MGTGGSILGNAPGSRTAWKRALVVSAAVALVLIGAGPAAAKKAPDCADANDDGNVSAADALDGLRTALDLSSCEPCRCDIDGSGDIVTADALAMLRLATGGDVDRDCPPCVTTTTTTTLPFVECGDPRAGAPACDGYCGVDGQMCVESPPFSGNCQCIFTPIPCGAAAGPPVCSGSCPKLRICMQVANTCECVF